MLARPTKMERTFSTCPQCEGSGCGVVSDLLAYPSSWSLIHLRNSDFWDAVGNFDPIPYWETVEQPALVILTASCSKVSHMARSAPPVVHIATPVKQYSAASSTRSPRARAS